jgi:cytochrome c553
MKSKIVSLLALLFALSFVASAKTSIDEGKAIFTTRCTSCHNVNKQMVGPALANIDQRRNIDWIISLCAFTKIYDRQIMTRMLSRFLINLTR